MINLRRQLKSAETEVTALTKITKERQTLYQQSQKELQKKRNLIKSLNERLKKSRELQVSEHAVLRYLERVEGMDIEAIKREIKSPKIEEIYKVIGGGKIPSGKGWRAVIKNHIIVTVED